MPPTAGAERVLERCEALAACSEEPDRLTRRFATPALRSAADLVSGWMRAAGMDVREDALGNVIGRRGAAGAPALALGSHLDTVRDAGRFDGALGVVAAIEVVAALPAGPAVEVHAFSDEEGTRFGAGYLGSAAVAGTFDAGWLERRDGEGTTLGEALARYGGDPDGVAGAARRPGELRAYLELHIEQGPVLERRGLPVGVVTAIAGQTRADVRLTGAAGHAGTVPMELRADALCAAAELVLAAEAEARATPGLVATVGEAAVHPGAANVIPGTVGLSLDVRHAEDPVRTGALGRLRARAEEIGRARGVAVDWTPRLDHGAVACDRALRDALSGAVAAAGVEPVELASGAGHDAAQLAAVAPVGMLFVRCAGGISHNPAESVRGEDVAVALEVLRRAAEELARP